MRTGVTQTLTNTAAYTATTIGLCPRRRRHHQHCRHGHRDGDRVRGPGQGRLHQDHQHTGESVCADTASLSVSDPNTWLYYCAILHNTGDITLARHALAEPALGFSTTFTHTLAPNDIYTVTNDILETELGQSLVFGPYTLYNGSNLTLNNTMFYTGNASAQGDGRRIRRPPTPTPLPG